MQHNPKSSNTNAAGYLDPTAAEAIKNVSEEDERVSRLIKAIKILIRLSGFEPINRLELKSKETGRIYR